MVKTPKTRHSKPRSGPVTIDLSADEIKRAETKSGDAPRETSAAADKSADSARGTDQAVKSDSGGTASSTPGARPAGSPAGPGPAGPIPSAFGRDAGRTPPPKTETTSKPAGIAPKSEPRRGNGLGALLAGIIGGIIALAAALALYLGGYLPAPSQSASASANSSAIEQMQTELAGLRDEIAAIKSAPPAASGDGGGALEQATNRLDNMAVMVEDLRTKISQLSDNAGTDGGAAMTALQDRLASIEQKIAALSENGGNGDDISADLTALKEEIGSLRDAASASATDVDSRIGAVEQAVAALTTRMDEQDEKPGAGLAISASALKAAIDRGQPFTSELDIFASLAPDAPQIDALRGMAAKGVPTAAAIAADADDAALRLIAAAKPKKSNAGLIDRLLASAGSLVTVRPIGAVEGDSVPAIVARMEAAVKAGDYAGAVAEYETLPDEAKAAGADFIARVKARQTADELIGKALADALRA